MTEKTEISLVDIQNTLNSFYTEMESFDPEKYEGLKKQIASIQDDIQLILLESQERYQARQDRRPERNKEFREYNRIGPKKAMAEFIKKDPAAFLARLETKGLRIDDQGTIHVGKLKKGNRIPEAIPVDFTPKTLLNGATNVTNYEHAKKGLEERGDKLISRLYTTLEETYAKSKNIFEGYSTPAELFNKLGIKVQKVEYSFFSKEDGKDKKLTGPRKSYNLDPVVNKDASAAPTFKKIGCLMKHVVDNNIPFRASNIVEDNTQRFQFYFYDKDITILISDVVVGNTFRDATFAIKGMVPGLKYIGKEDLKKYQGRKIMFNDTWAGRIEGIFTDNPENRPAIGEEKEDTENMKTFITDRAQFIAIIKEQFPTSESLNVPSYAAFAKQYNEAKEHTLLLRETICGNASLLGLGGKKTIHAIRNAIFDATKPKLEISKDAFFSNEHIKNQLMAISSCEGFDPEKTVGSCTYSNWVLELLRKSCNAEFVDDVKNKSPREKREKLKAYTGIDNIPLFAKKLTSMLGGRITCVDAEYHKMLRKRFFMYTSEQTILEAYKDLQKTILLFETKREDTALRPNTNRVDKNPNTDVGEKKDIPEKKPDEIVQVKPVIKKSIPVTTVTSGTEKQVQEVLTNTDFELYQVKKAIIMKEFPTYRLLSIPGNEKELRLYKSHLFDQKQISIGQELPIFGINKCIEEPYVTVYIEKVDGDHKVAEFRDTHDDSLIKKMSHDKKCRGVINNIAGQYIYVSLTKSYTGRLPRDTRQQYKRGDAIRVIFDRVLSDQEKKVVKIR
ncbi:MAG: hypothetical protein NT085_03335 [candidate division SR1 bacterium]|nr:hypothetical protein [candidate division SR1 bacterium]